MDSSSDSDSFDDPFYQEYRQCVDIRQQRSETKKSFIRCGPAFVQYALDDGYEFDGDDVLYAFEIDDFESANLLVGHVKITNSKIIEFAIKKNKRELFEKYIVADGLFVKDTAAEAAVEYENQDILTRLMFIDADAFVVGIEKAIYFDRDYFWMVSFRNGVREMVDKVKKAELSNADLHNTIVKICGGYAKRNGSFVMPDKVPGVFNVICRAVCNFDIVGIDELILRLTRSVWKYTIDYRNPVILTLKDIYINKRAFDGGRVLNREVFAKEFGIQFNDGG